MIHGGAILSFDFDFCASRGVAQHRKTSFQSTCRALGWSPKPNLLHNPELLIYAKSNNWVWTPDTSIRKQKCVGFTLAHFGYELPMGCLSSVCMFKPKTWLWFFGFPTILQTNSFACQKNKKNDLPIHFLFIGYYGSGADPDLYKSEVCEGVILPSIHLRVTRGSLCFLGTLTLLKVRLVGRPCFAQSLKLVRVWLCPHRHPH